jgi:uncharacterized protein YecE (DUF72 family)
MSSLHIGTSAFTAAGWENTFYPPDAKPQDYLYYYSQRFNSVEVDSTFYRIPSQAMVQAWNRKTPAGFVFAAKIPQVITHHKVLEDCELELRQFLTAMDFLGDKLGPLLFQFGYFNRGIFPTVKDFLGRLRPFLKQLPRDHQFAVEIRNKAWLDSPLVELLREYGVALALIDQSWMPPAAAWFDKFDPITAKFTYVRWLGDRKGIEALTKVWDKTIVDRRVELTQWAEVLDKVRQIKIPIYAYANNHYAGHGPATVEIFKALWRARGGEISEPTKVKPAAPETLFPL